MKAWHSMQQTFEFLDLVDCVSESGDIWLSWCGLKWISMVCRLICYVVWNCGCFDVVRWLRSVYWNWTNRLASLDLLTVRMWWIWCWSCSVLICIILRRTFVLSIAFWIDIHLDRRVEERIERWEETWPVVTLAKFLHLVIIFKARRHGRRTSSRQLFWRSIDALWFHKIEPLWTGLVWFWAPCHFDSRLWLVLASE